MVIDISIWVMKNRFKVLNIRDHYYYWLRIGGCRN
jgi:hypothetical protein